MGHILGAVVLVGALAGGFFLARGLPGARSTTVAPATVVAAPTVAAGGSPGTGAQTLRGQLAPGIVGTTLDGQPASLADYAGQATLVNFWATWCPPCRQEMPWLQQAYQRHQGEGFVVLAVNAGERVNPELTLQKIQRFVADNALSLPQLLPTNSEQAQVNYLVSALPASFLVDRRGLITEVVSGAFPSADAVEAAVQRLLTAATGGG